MLSDPRARSIAIGVGVVLLVGATVLLGSGLWGSNPEKLLALSNPSPEEIQQIADLLRSQDLMARRKASAKLAQIGAKALPALEKLIEGDDAEARMAAFVIASRVDPEATLGIIDRALDDPDRPKRGMALRLLQNAPDGDPKIDLYIKALSDDDPRIRADAAGSLGNYKGAKIVKALKAKSDDSDGKVREHVRNALQRVSGKRPPAKARRPKRR